jgi:hypothetical protein
MTFSSKKYRSKLVLTAEREAGGHWVFRVVPRTWQSVLLWSANVRDAVSVQLHAIMALAQVQRLLAQPSPL